MSCRCPAFTAAREYDADFSHVKQTSQNNIQLYSNIGFILHLKPTNLEFGRLTWFRGSEGKWVSSKS